MNSSKVTQSSSKGSLSFYKEIDEATKLKITGGDKVYARYMVDKNNVPLKVSDIPSISYFSNL